MVGVWSGSGNPNVYIDGVLDNAATVSGGTMSTITTAAHTRIGSTPESGSGYECYFNGNIDEVRSSKTARSADWIKTEYNNQKSPSTFYSVSVASSAMVNLQWQVTDQLGTPRMVFDKTGVLANVKRHDYQPFGEEIFAGTGGRTTTMGYSAADGVRQKFTQKERDNETGLDYFNARYFSFIQGRFTTPDDFLNDTHASDPAGWNLYAYCRNNPLRFIDPLGQDIENTTDANLLRLTDEQLEAIAADLRKKTGLSSIAFKAGTLTYDKNEEASGGSTKLRIGITGAINDHTKIYQLSDKSNTKVNFMATDQGTTTTVHGAPGPTTYQIGIDFADYDSAADLSDTDALAAFSLGSGIYHETNHKESYDSSDPMLKSFAFGTRPDNSPDGGHTPGVIDNENWANFELNRAQRVDAHNATRSPALGSHFGQIRFLDSSGRQKLIRWHLEASQ
jgi:RHS repeat-associated protein